MIKCPNAITIFMIVWIGSPLKLNNYLFFPQLPFTLMAFFSRWSCSVYIDYRSSFIFVNVIFLSDAEPQQLHIGNQDYPKIKRRKGNAIVL